MGVHADAVAFVGGAAILGSAVDAGLGLAQLVRRGLPADAVRFMLESGRLSPVELDRIVLPRRTLAHRRRLGTLTPEQSDRLVRVARVLAMAEDTFGNQAEAAIWLRRRNTALSGEQPIDLLDTDGGTREVETLLGRIAYGIAA
ncbi:MAG: DUF2384 domain-containing protein [Gluconacetobacter diazotrophicus]|nr:DUF2384 domain-containing protein [Gluconacetobacter diazotrophicus]